MRICEGGGGRGEGGECEGVWVGGYYILEGVRVNAIACLAFFFFILLFVTDKRRCERGVCV